MPGMKDAKPAQILRQTLPLIWPDPPLSIALVEPEIPPNTGNIARLCAATSTILHLVGKLGFELSDAALKRAGLDYWDSVQIAIHENFETFRQSFTTTQFYFLSTRAKKSYTEVQYRPGDMLVFGCETRGLPNEIIAANREHLLGIPMRTRAVRSLNLSTAAGIVLYEALRQISNRAGTCRVTGGPGIPEKDTGQTAEGTCSDHSPGTVS